jgi:hypothetical protein
MKKTIITLLLAAASLSTFAQFKVRIGAQAGLSIANPTTNIDAYKDLNGITFIQPGLIFDLPVSKFFSIKPGINYLQTGANVTFKDTIPFFNYIQTANHIAKLNNIQIPVDLNIPIKLGPGKLLLSAGPTINLALSGIVKSAFSTTQPGVSASNTSSNIRFNDSIGNYARVNWGTQFGVGYGLNNGLELRGIYNLGMSNIQNLTNTTDKLRNNVLTIMLSYYFLNPKSDD